MWKVCLKLVRLSEQFVFRVLGNGALFQEMCLDNGKTVNTTTDKLTSLREISNKHTFIAIACSEQYEADWNLFRAKIKYPLACKANMIPASYLQIKQTQNTEPVLSLFILCSIHIWLQHYYTNECNCVTGITQLFGCFKIIKSTKYNS